MNSEEHPQMPPGVTRRGAAIIAFVFGVVGVIGVVLAVLAVTLDWSGTMGGDTFLAAMALIVGGICLYLCYRVVARNLV